MRIYTGNDHVLPKMYNLLSQLTTYQFATGLPTTLQKNTVIINASYLYVDRPNIIKDNISPKHSHIIITGFTDPYCWAEPTITKLFPNGGFNKVTLVEFSNFLQQGMVSHHIFKGSYYNQSFPLDIKYVFLNYNRMPRWHRKRLVKTLLSRGLDKHGIITLGTAPNKPHDIVIPHNNFLENNSAIVDPRWDIGSGHDINLDVTYSVPHDALSLGSSKIWNQSFVNVISETTIHELFLSEKTFKPIVGKRPFILCGPKYTLALLRDHGFKTFGDYWDESYDNEPSVTIRCEMIADILESLCGMSQQHLMQMYKSMTDILEFNHNYLFTTFIRNNRTAFLDLPNKYIDYYNI